MSKKTYQLKDGQYLSDLSLNIEPQKNIFLIAPTGSGKTTFTMKDLGTQFDLVIVLVPTQAKVIELKSEFNLKKGNYKFFSGNEGPDSELSKFKGTIVATYDKFQKILLNLSDVQKQNAILVIDEAHKLYSAGSFRDEALTPVLQALKNKTITTNLFLTATKTQELFDQLNLHIDLNYKVTFNTPIQRKIKVVHLSNGDQYTSVVYIEKRIQQLKAHYNKLGKAAQKKVILVRVNSREKCDQFKAYFEQKWQLKCLSVHSYSKNDSDVSKIFEKQMIPTDIEIVFTTSIMDEAVNLTNSQEQVDSVFILGKQAHVEEIVQFIGRFRSANVPCFLLLHTLIEQFSEKSNEDTHQEALNKRNGFIQRVNDIAQAMSSLFEDYVSDLDTDENVESPSIHSKVRQMNASFHDWFNCKLFAVYDNRAIPNTASLVSTLYRMDTASTYSSFGYLKWRLQQFLPNVSISFSDNARLKTLSETQAFFDKMRVNSAQAYKDSIDTGMQLFLDQKRPDDLILSNIMEISSFFNEKKSNDEDFIKSLVQANPKVLHQEATVKVLNDVILLAKHIRNLHDIKTILQDGKTTVVVKAAQGYADNAFVQKALERLYKGIPKKVFDTDCKLTGSEASKQLSHIIQQVQKDNKWPMKTIIKKGLIKGMKYDEQKDEPILKESTSLNFFATYFAVNDRNKNKPTKRYLQFLPEIIIGGFEYVAVKQSHRNSAQKHSEFVISDELKYDNYTGKRILKKVLLDLPEDVFEDDSDDVCLC